MKGRGLGEGKRNGEKKGMEEKGLIIRLLFFYIEGNRAQGKIRDGEEEEEEAY